MRILVIHGIDGRVDRLESLLATTHGRRAEAIFVLGNLVKADARRRAHMDHQPSRPVSPEVKAQVNHERKQDQETYARIAALLAETNVPVFLIPGEQDAPLAQFQHAFVAGPEATRIHVVHRHATLLDSQTVVAGFGGRLEGTTHSDHYLLQFPDWEVRLAFEHLNAFTPIFNFAERRIFLFGTPLRGKHIDLEGGQHAGVETLNLVSRAYQPQLICCAGPARSRGIETIDGAVVVNPGWLASGSYAWVTLDESHVKAELNWLHAPMRIQTLVVAIDGSEEAWAALDLVPALAHGTQVKVVLVHAFEPVNTTVGYPYDDSLIAKRVEHGEQLLKQAADGIRELAPQCELLEGPAAEAIVRVAEQSKADLILMGSRGLGRFRGLMGSVSQQVLQRAGCPVLVAPGVVYQQADVNVGEPVETHHAG